jgi:hypothetical protein
LAEFKALNQAIPQTSQTSIRRKTQLQSHLKTVDREIRKIVTLPENIVPFLVQGRLIKVSIQGS